MDNQKNTKVVREYLEYLKQEEKGEKECKISALNYLRDFFEDKDFAEVDTADLKQFFLYLQQKMRCSDQFLSGIGEELRRFFGFLSKRGINANWMNNIITPVRKGERKKKR